MVKQNAGFSAGNLLSIIDIRG